MARNKWASSSVGLAPGTQVGLMICCSCHKSIEEGLFRYREGKLGYITQHKHCSLEDPLWQRVQNAEDEAKARNEEFNKDALAFIAKWGRVDLGDLSDEELGVTNA